MTVAALVGFARALRDAGVGADAHRVPAMLAAVDLLGVDEVYWAGRLTLCAEPDDLPVYDRVFDAYFTKGTRKRQPLPTAPTMPSLLNVTPEVTPTPRSTSMNARRDEACALVDTDYSVC